MEEESNAENNTIIAQATFEKAEERLKNAVSALSIAHNGLSNAHNALSNAQNALSAWTVKNADYDGSEPGYQVRRDSVESARKEVESARKEVESARKEVDKRIAELDDREKRLQKCKAELEQIRQKLVHEKKRKRENDDLKELSELADIMGPASSFAKSTGQYRWYDFLQKYKNQICTYRVPVDGESPPPITLLCKIFAEFVYNCQSAQYGKADCEFVRTLCDTMTKQYVHEDALSQELRDHLTNYLGQHVNKETLTRSANDGSIYVKKRVILNLGVKKQKGEGGGDPLMQNISYYMKQSGKVDRQLPCLLVDICGPLLSVNAITNTDRHHLLVEPLVSSWPLIYVDNQSLMQGLVRVCLSLKMAVKQLVDEAEKDLIYVDLDRYQYPYHDTFKHNQLVHNLNYQNRVAGYVFVANTKNIGEVIVKFAKSYGVETHQYFESAGYAPKLYDHQVLYDDWHFIVMEKLNLKPIKCGDTNVIKQDLDALEHLLQESDHVHGDLRQNNIKWNIETKRSVVIDFDWAGTHNIKMYPPFMNSEDIRWPEGAETGQPLLHKHDLHWITELRQDLFRFEDP